MSFVVAAPLIDHEKLSNILDRLGVHISLFAFRHLRPICTTATLSHFYRFCPSSSSSTQQRNIFILGWGNLICILRLLFTHLPTPLPHPLSHTHTHTQISHLSQLTSLGQGPVTAFYFPFLCLCRERRLTVTGLLTITDQDQKLTDLSEILARHGGRGLLPDTTFEIQIIPSLLEELTN